jgi:DNA-binding XRE family transcriptional regulator
VALTQDQLAKQIGVARITISSWENGDNSPRIQYIRRLSKALEVTVSDVYEAIEETRKRTHPEEYPDEGS